MPRTKKEEGGHPTTINLYETQRIKLEEISKKNSRTSSETIRELIEHAHSQCFEDTEEELKLRKTKLESLINDLECMFEEKTKTLPTIVKKYMERRKGTDIGALVNYEPRSKKWILANINELLEVFPNKSVDDIYKELEIMTKVKP
jgi:hypothetical protein